MSARDRISVRDVVLGVGCLGLLWLSFRPDVDAPRVAAPREGAPRAERVTWPRSDQTAGDAEVGETHRVVRVVDGDTVELSGPDGRTEKVRVRGIDTPESHASSKLDRDAARSDLGRGAIRELGRAASAHAAALLPSGVSVVLEERPERDRYGRLVSYVDVAADARGPYDVGARMIAEGYAHAYTGGGRYPHPNADDYAALEREARSSRAGLWADGALGELSPATP